MGVETWCRSKAPWSGLGAPPRQQVKRARSSTDECPSQGLIPGPASARWTEGREGGEDQRAYAVRTLAKCSLLLCYRGLLEACKCRMFGSVCCRDGVLASWLCGGRGGLVT